MAIGIGRLFGISLPLNFASPYKSLSITEFWRRWHMTLSRFLKDYLYISLGGNRKGAVRTDINLMATMLLGGLWHGAGWNFVIWGGLHGIYLVMHKFWMKLVPARLRTIVMPSVLAWFLTFMSVVIGWVFFRATSFSSALIILQGMFSDRFYLSEKYAGKLEHVLFFMNIDINENASRYLDLRSAKYVIFLLLIAVVFPNTQQFMRNFQPALNVDSNYASNRLVWSPSTIWLFVILVMGAWSISGLSNISEFLYFQF